MQNSFIGIEKAKKVFEWNLGRIFFVRASTPNISFERVKTSKIFLNSKKNISKKPAKEKEGKLCQRRRKYGYLAPAFISNLAPYKTDGFN